MPAGTRPKPYKRAPTLAASRLLHRRSPLPAGRALDRKKLAAFSAPSDHAEVMCRHLAREGVVEHPLHAVPKGGAASTGGGPMKTPKAMGPEKPGIVAATSPITDTVLSPWFAT